jgi:hypothetical protein
LIFEKKQVFLQAKQLQNNTETAPKQVETPAKHWETGIKQD